MPAITRKDFLGDYIFPEPPAEDFQRHGKPAEYASGHPKEWGQETASFDIENKTKDEPERAYTNYYTAISSDLKLLAISSSHERILIYDIEAKEERAVLEGAGSIAFRPTVVPATSATEGETSDERHGRPAYTLVSSISDEAQRGGREQNKLILWELDQNGRLMVDEEHIDPSAFATQAINAILPDLEAKHEWSRDFVLASSLHTDLEKALSHVAANYRRRHNTILDNARLGSFGSSPFSSDGQLFLYHSRNRTTQHGQRDPDNLPHVIVYDVDAGKEVHQLSGHTDSIMWSGFSPDGKHIASVSWDSSMRMYSGETGELEWSTKGAGNQSWAAAFSPDSKYIVWSSHGGQDIKVHDVAQGRFLSQFPEKLNRWCRWFDWHPDGQQIAFCAGREAYVWRPFDTPEQTIVQHFSLDNDHRWRHMCEVQGISWKDEGRLLFLQMSECTKLVYNTETNSKELFKRPKSTETGWIKEGFYGVFEREGDENFYLSVDGDGKVRYWRLSVAASSWWEGEKADNVAQVPKKKLYPETGKYVKVTKQAKKDDAAPKADREGWVEKGAGLWTAE